MADTNYEIKLNRHWDDDYIPTVTVITPTYNRYDELNRAMRSVKNQTYKDKEYIIVNDGSPADIDYMVTEFMENADFPVMYIKKPNGGVHTARNAAYRNARGKMVIGIDDDDELLPNAIELLMRVWDNIPDSEKGKYVGIKARYYDTNGKFYGNFFQSNINELSMKDAVIAASKAGADCISIMQSDVKKNNLFPEPEGITFVAESIFWQHFITRYRFFYSNEVVGVVHTESEDSITRNKIITIQRIKNSTFNLAWVMNHRKEDKYPFWEYIKKTVRYCVYSHILTRRLKSYKVPIKGFLNNFIFVILFFPSLIYSFYYEKRIV